MDKIKEPTGLKGGLITSVAWDEENKNVYSTGSILISDENNSIYEYKIEIDLDNNIKEKIIL